MRISLTKYGLPQVAIFPLTIVAVMLLVLLAGLTVLTNWIVISIEIVLAALLIFVLSFFRDPKRTPPCNENLLLSPADGTVSDIETVQDDYINGPALRIGIFLSVFNTHINRAPCDIKVEQIQYKKGKFKDARNPLAGKINESNDLKLIRTNEPNDKLIVRQISGAIARRIVCKVTEGETLTKGQKFGMIKFGSRTELYLPARDNIKCMVEIGDKVKAGLTVLAKYN